MRNSFLSNLPIQPLVALPCKTDLNIQFYYLNWAFFFFKICLQISLIQTTAIALKIHKYVFNNFKIAKKVHNN